MSDSPGMNATLPLPLQPRPIVDMNSTAPAVNSNPESPAPVAGTVESREEKKVRYNYFVFLFLFLFFFRRYEKQSFRNQYFSPSWSCFPCISEIPVHQMFSLPHDRPYSLPFLPRPTLLDHPSLSLLWSLQDESPAAAPAPAPAAPAPAHPSAIETRRTVRGLAGKMLAGINR